MRLLKALLLSVMLSLSFSLSYCYGSPDERLLSVWLVLRLRDYQTDMPISDTSVKATIYTDWGETRIGYYAPVSTNETGVIQILLKQAAWEPASPRSKSSRLLELGLSNNYTLIKIDDLFMEEAEFTAEYSPNYTMYDGKPFSIANLAHKHTENQTFIEGNLWVLKSKLIKVSDCDPITGEKATLSMKPAIKENPFADSYTGGYEGHYLFPLNYEVTVTHEDYPPLKVIIEENTTLVNWMHHAAKTYANLETLNLIEEMLWLNSSGFYLAREVEEYQAIESLLNHVLELYQKGEYTPALGGVRISEKRLYSLETWLLNLRRYALLTSVGICLFAYGLASLLSSFIFEEASENKSRVASKAVIFASLMLIFSITHPSLKIAYAIIIENAVGARVPNIDLPTSLLGSFVTGSVTYFLITLISVKKTPMRDLAIQLGIRSLKRRKSRTILTLATITIIVSSAIVFVNVSLSRSTKVKDSWAGTELPSVLIQPDISLVPLSEYDVNWTRMQEWCKDLGYREEIRMKERRGDLEVERRGLLLSDTSTVQVDIIGIDPVFTDRYYNLSKHVRGLWQDFSEGKSVAIVPTSYDASINDYVKLTVGEFTLTQRGIMPLGERTLGSFRIVGKFDPLALSRLRKIDNSLLFEDTVDLVLIPIKAAVDPSMVISEVTIITEEGVDPGELARDLAYMLGMAAIANKDGLAVRIEWSVELSAVGFVPYLFPLAIASLMVYVTMVSVYEERKREFTTLATLGLDPKNTFQIFIVEVLLLGLMGTFFGFFGSYLIVFITFHLANLLSVQGMPALTLSYALWSMPAILVALFTGVIMVFLGGYVPATRARGSSLMGRVKKRRLVGELISEGDVTSFTLPIKTTIQTAEMLYTYVRETIGKVKSSLVDPHSVKGEIHRDGSFKVSFFTWGVERDVYVPCEIKGIREGESLVSAIEFPTRYKDYQRMRGMLRDLEEYMIGFSAWKEIQLKMKVVREAPKRRKTLEEVVAEIEGIIAQIKDSSKKLKILDAQKDQLSEEVFTEFREKYSIKIDGLSKSLRSMAIGLEPHHKQLEGEIKKLEVEVERITIAYNLGEVSEEEYIKTCGPLQGRLATLKSKLEELEDIFEFLKTPSRLA